MYATQSIPKDQLAGCRYGSIVSAVESLVLRAISNQEIIIDAALTKNKHLAFQAFLNDPLMTLPTDRAHDLFTEMFTATKPW